MSAKNLRKRPLIIAHRGNSSECPKNTLEAFQSALACGADGIKLDVQKTKDLVRWSIDVDSALAGLSVEDDTSFTWKAGGGADYYVTESAAVFVEGSYFSSDYESDVTNIAAAPLDVNVEGFTVGGGIKFSI